MYLDEIAQDYKRILRTIRISRGVVASQLVTPLLIIAITPIFAPMEEEMGKVWAWIIAGYFILTPLAVFIYSQWHRRLAAGRIGAASFGLGLSYLTGFLIIPLFGFYFILAFLKDVSINVYITLSLSTLLFAYLWALFHPGLRVLSNNRRNPLFPLVCDHRLMKSFGRDVLSMLGLNILKGQRGVRYFLAAIIVSLACILDGFAFSMYLRQPQDLWKRAKYTLQDTKIETMDINDFLINPRDIWMVPIAIFVGVQLPFFVSRRFRRFSRRLVLISAEKLRQSDRRPPILFLRSFMDDQISLKTARVPLHLRFLDPMTLAGNLEEMLVQYYGNYGPTIAIGNPEDRIPPLGAARQYVQGHHWKDVVISLMDEARIIIVGVNFTDSIIWEIETLKNRDLLQKTLFIWPPELCNDRSILTNVSSVLGIELERALENTVKLEKPHSVTNARIISLAFDKDNKPLILAAKDATEIEYELAIRAALRHQVDMGLIATL